MKHKPMTRYHSNPITSRADKVTVPKALWEVWLSDKSSADLADAMEPLLTDDLSRGLASAPIGMSGSSRNVRALRLLRVELGPGVPRDSAMHITSILTLININK